jgi:hypothetical protein
MKMADLEKDYHPHDAGRSHLDDDSSSNEQVQDPLGLPPLVVPLDGSAAGKPPTEEPPPNGGLQAWLQVLGSFFLFFNSW